MPLFGALAPCSLTYGPSGWRRRRKRSGRLVPPCPWRRRKPRAPACTDAAFRRAAGLAPSRKKRSQPGQTQSNPVQPSPTQSNPVQPGQTESNRSNRSDPVKPKPRKPLVSTIISGNSGRESVFEHARLGWRLALPTTRGPRLLSGSDHVHKPEPLLIIIVILISSCD
jgi:hypothetical protein